MENEPLEMLLHQTQHAYMRYAMSSLHGETEQLRGGQAGILMMLKYKGGMAQKELAEKLHFAAPSITTAIKKLDALGYVVRKQDEHDQRIMRLSITPKGETFVNHFIQAARKAEEVAMKDVTEEEQAILRKVLIKMKENLAVERA